MILCNEKKVEYLTGVVDSVFKVLPLYEEKNEGLVLYVEGLLSELYGAQTSINLKEAPDFISLVSTLEAVKMDVEIDDNKQMVKRNVFKSINLIKSIIEKIDGDEIV
ncbi:MAG: hypothetical protein ACRC4N_02490 [Gammaproteobacteria bacterium]